MKPPYWMWFRRAILTLVGAFAIYAFLSMLQVWRDVVAVQQDAVLFTQETRHVETTAQLNDASLTLDLALRDSQRLHNSLNKGLFFPVLRHVPWTQQIIAALDALGVRSHEVFALARQSRGDAEALIQHPVGFKIPMQALNNLNRDLSAIRTITRAPLPKPPWPLVSKWQHASAKFREVESRLGALSNGLNAVEQFLGGAGTRHYLIAVENEAEMRDQGSVLALGTLTITNGSLSFSQVQNYTAFPLTQEVAVPYPAGTASVFANDRPRQLWQNVNVTANFPFSAEVLAAMYRQSTGVQVDGVVALNVHTLQSMLQVTGPVRAPGIAPLLTSQNAVQILLHDLYSKFPPGPQLERHDILSSAAGAVVARLSHHGASPTTLLRLLQREIAGRNLLLWSRTSSVQQEIRSIDASGELDTVLPNNTFHVAVENATATKLDYFIQTQVRQKLVIRRNGSIGCDIWLTVTNTAPAGQAPSYQLGPDGTSSHHPGEYVAATYLWVPSSSSSPYVQPESGLQVLGGSVDLMPGASSTQHYFVVFQPTNAPRSLTVRWVASPRVHPVSLSVAIQRETANGLASVGLFSKDLSVTTSHTWTW